MGAAVGAWVGAAVGAWVGAAVVHCTLQTMASAGRPPKSFSHSENGAAVGSVSSLPSSYTQPIERVRVPLPHVAEHADHAAGLYRACLHVGTAHSADVPAVHPLQKLLFTVRPLELRHCTARVLTPFSLAAAHEREHGPHADIWQPYVTTGTAGGSAVGPQIWSRHGCVARQRSHADATSGFWSNSQS